MRIFRLELWQPDGRWTGPYCAEYMTTQAFEIRDRMTVDHRNSPAHPFPDAQIFIKHPGPDRYVCGSVSIAKLTAWFGPYFMPFIHQGGHIGVYEVPKAAIILMDNYQIIYQQRQAILLTRRGIYRPLSGELTERIHPDKLKK